MKTRMWQLLGMAAFLSAAAVFAYLPVLSFSFTNWDDPIWVLNNLYIRDFNPVSLKWMFTGLLLGTWTPMTWLSYSLDYRLGGLEPYVYHLHNLLLHCGATVLVYLAFSKLGELAPKPVTGVHPIRASAWIAALFFGLHPLHVENVAWVSDRIDLLCAVFCLTSLLFYLHHVANGLRAPYIASLVCFYLALASKPMAITLPFVLIALEVWPLRKPWRGLWDSLEGKKFFILPALVVAVMAFLARARENSVSGLGDVPLDFRVMNAFHSLTFYLTKILAPFNLCPLYPMFRDRTYSAPYALSLIVCVIITVGCYWARKKSPGFGIAWFIYVVALAPTLGIVTIGSQAAADRYAYLPSLVPFLFLALVLNRLFSGKRIFLATAALVLGTAMAVGTRQQAAIWKDSKTLWTHELRLFPVNYESAYSGLGDAYRELGNLDNALKLYEMAISNSPDLSFLNNGKAAILLEMGQLKEAVQASLDALAKSAPADEQAGWAHGRLDILYHRLGLSAQAAIEREMALSSAPQNAWQHFDLGTQYEKYGFGGPALAQYQEAVRLYPWYAECWARMGGVYAAQSDFARAVDCYRKAVDLEPRNRSYKELLNMALSQTAE